jgi:hypothetical protein
MRNTRFVAESLAIVGLTMLIAYILGIVFSGLHTYIGLGLAAVLGIGIAVAPQGRDLTPDQRRLVAFVAFVALAGLALVAYAVSRPLYITVP